MGRLIAKTWKVILGVTALVGIIYLPADLADFFVTYPRLGAVMSSIDRFGFLVAYAAVLTLYLLASEAWPHLQKWWVKKEAESIAFQSGIYIETEAISSNTEDSKSLYATYYYLVVGNRAADGKTLRRVQCRAFHFGPPHQLQLRDDGALECDIRHGEWSLFLVGRIVSEEVRGLFNSRSTELPPNRIIAYNHNLGLGHFSFEFCDAGRLSTHSLALRFPSEGHSWNLLVVASADDVKARSVSVKVEMEAGVPVLSWTEVDSADH